jgi:hypothetical protein
MKIYIYKNSHTVKGNIEANAAVDASPLSLTLIRALTQLLYINFI